MSMDKSLKRSGGLLRARSVLTRAERITRLKSEERWTDSTPPLHLPKVKVLRLVIKKAKKAKEEAAAEGAAPAEGAAAPAAAAGAKPAAAGGKPAAAAKPAAKGGEKGKGK